MSPGACRRRRRRRPPSALRPAAVGRGAARAPTGRDSESSHCRDRTSVAPALRSASRGGPPQRCGRSAHHDAGNPRGGVPPPRLPAATRCQRRRALSPRVGATPKRSLRPWRPCRGARRRGDCARGSAGNPRGGVPPRPVPAPSQCRAAGPAGAPKPQRAAGADRRSPMTARHGPGCAWAPTRSASAEKSGN